MSSPDTALQLLAVYTLFLFSVTVTADVLKTQARACSCCSIFYDIGSGLHPADQNSYALACQLGTVLNFTLG